MRSTATAAVLALMGTHLAYAQRGTGDWMTSGFDAQRSSWVRSDGKISPESMRKPGFELAWKLKLNAGQLTPPSLLDFYIGYRGFRALGFIGGSAGQVIALDTELGRVEWAKKLGGVISAVARPTGTMYPPAPAGRGGGRGTPAKSGVGAPYEGAVTIRKEAPAPVRPVRPAPAAVAAAPSPFAPRVQYAVALSGDGKLHMMYVSNGEEPNPAVQFLPPGASAQGLVVYGETAYAATVNGVWALDIASGKVSSWKAEKSVAGTAGTAAGPDGTLYVAAGNQLTALAAKTLEVKGTYRSVGGEFTSSPVVFEFKGKNLIAAATKDGRLHVVDAAAMGTAAASGPGGGAGSLTSWQDPAGVRWILAASGGAVAGWKVVESGGKMGIEKGWRSEDIGAQMPPLVINGVVFAAGGSALYALDSITGSKLWDSGKTISGKVTGGLAAGGSRVYVATEDGTQYAFGFPIEH